MVIAVVIFAFRANALTQTSLNAQPGLWEIKTTGGGLRVPVKRCVTAHDIADPARLAKAFGHPFNPMVSRMPDPSYHTLAEQLKQTCKFSDVTQTVDSFKYKYECNSDFRSSEDGALKFDTPTHYSAQFDFQGDDEANVQAAIRTISTEGTRIVAGSSNPMSGGATP